MTSLMIERLLRGGVTLSTDAGGGRVAWLRSSEHAARQTIRVLPSTMSDVVVLECGPMVATVLREQVQPGRGFGTTIGDVEIPGFHIDHAHVVRAVTWVLAGIDVGAAEPEVVCFGCDRLVEATLTEQHTVEHAEPPYWRTERFCPSCVDREVML